MYLKMKILLISLVFNYSLWATECSTISRVNNAANAVLTSVKYNLDHNTAYTAVNDIISANCTIPFSAIATSGAQAFYDGAQLGCELSYASAGGVTVAACDLAVSGSLVSTNSSQNISFGCVGCAVEATDTVYYVVANNGSSGSTLNLGIQDATPSAKGYIGSNRVIGSFYNNASGDIEEFSISNWLIKGFERKTNDVVFRAGISSTFNINTANETTIIFDSLNNSSSGHFDFSKQSYNPTNGQFTAPADGIYRLVLFAQLGSAISEAYALRVRDVNTTNILASAVINGTSGESVSITATLFLNENQVIAASIDSTSDNSYNLQVGGTNFSVDGD